MDVLSFDAPLLELLRSLDCQRLHQLRDDSATIGHASVECARPARQNRAGRCTARRADYSRARISTNHLARPCAKHGTRCNLGEIAAARTGANLIQLSIRHPRAHRIRASVERDRLDLYIDTATALHFVPLNRGHQSDRSSALRNHGAIRSGYLIDENRVETITDVGGIGAYPAFSLQVELGSRRYDAGSIG